MADFTGAELDTLVALVERGPLESGDVPSKSGRESLIDRGFAAHIIVKLEEGFSAATLAGKEAYKDYFGGENMAEARANRIANRAITNASIRKEAP